MRLMDDATSHSGKRLTCWAVTVAAREHKRSSPKTSAPGLGCSRPSLHDLRQHDRSLTSLAAQIPCTTCWSSQVVRTTLLMFLRSSMLAHIAQQIQVNPDAWTEYAARDETRREHAIELQSIFGYRPFTIAEYRRLRGWLTGLALQTNKAAALAEQLIESFRSQRVIVPAVTIIDRLCAEALARGAKLLYQRLTQLLEEGCRTKLDALLLPREDLRTVVLTWLRQPPGEPKARNVLAHLELKWR